MKVIEIFSHLAPRLSILFFIIYKGFNYIWYELNYKDILLAKLLVLSLSLFLIVGFCLTLMAIREDAINKIFETRAISWSIFNYSGRIRQVTTEKKFKARIKRRKRKLVKVVV